MDVRRGELNPEMTNTIVKVAGALNKAHENSLNYKKISQHKKPIKFFQDGLG